MSTQRYVLLSYIVLAFLLGLVLERLVGSVAGAVPFLGFLNTTTFGTERFGAAAVGYALAIGLALYAWFNVRIKTLGTEVVEELQRVTWPTWPETRANTIAVIAATVICAVLLGLFDYAWNAVTEQIYSPQ